MQQCALALSYEPSDNNLILNTYIVGIIMSSNCASSIKKVPCTIKLRNSPLIALDHNLNALGSHVTKCTTFFIPYSSGKYCV